MEASGPTSWTSIRSRTCNWTVQSSILNIWIHLIRSFAGSRRDILRWCARLRKAQLVLSLTLREEIDSLEYAYFISWCGELTLRCDMWLWEVRSLRRTVVQFSCAKPCRQPKRCFFLLRCLDATFKHLPKTALFMFVHVCICKSRRLHHPIFAYLLVTYKKPA